MRWIVLLALLALPAHAAGTPDELKAGHSLDRILVRFRPEALAGPTDAAPGPAELARLGWPAGARLEPSGFTRWQSAALGRAPESLDSGDWMYCYRPPTQSVDQLVAGLKKNPLLVYAEYDHIGYGCSLPTDPAFTQQWHHSNRVTTNMAEPSVQSVAAWDITTGSTGVTLAVLDTGIATGVTEFAGRLLPGYNFAYTNDNVSDDHGHGTAVAGTAAANANNGVGGCGLDWFCRILPVKVLNSGNWGWYSDWASGIGYAVAQGADVINLSAGGTSDDSTLSNAVMGAIQAGVIFVAAAGNGSSSTVIFPGRMDPVIAVAATTTNDGRTTFSNYGTNIDLCAPGSNIATVAMGGGVATWWGTSFAAPLVAGAATLLRSIRPDLNQQAVKTLLCASADDQVGSPSEDVAGFDPYYGWGRLNVHSALQLANASIRTVTNGPDGQVSITWSAPTNAMVRRPFRVESAPGLDQPWTTAVDQADISYGSNVASWNHYHGPTNMFYRLAIPPP